MQELNSKTNELFLAKKELFEGKILIREEGTREKRSKRSQMGRRMTREIQNSEISIDTMDDAEGNSIKNVTEKSLPEDSAEIGAEIGADKCKGMEKANDLIVNSHLEKIDQPLDLIDRKVDLNDSSPNHIQLNSIEDLHLVSKIQTIETTVPSNEALASANESMDIQQSYSRKNGSITSPIPASPIGSDSMVMQMFLLACSTGQVDNVKETLESCPSININGKDETGNTPLHYAIMIGNAEMVSLLLNHGADPSIQDEKGRDARKWASRSANQQLKNMILNHEVVPSSSLDTVSDNLNQHAATSLNRSPRKSIFSKKNSENVDSAISPFDDSKKIDSALDLSNESKNTAEKQDANNSSDGPKKLDSALDLSGSMKIESSFTLPDTGGHEGEFAFNHGSKVSELADQPVSDDNEAYQQDQADNSSDALFQLKNDQLEQNKQKQKDQPPTLSISTSQRTSIPGILGAEPNDAFDWTEGKLSDMIPFDADSSAYILNVAIRTIVPSKKSKFQPLGANVLFLCARYACYHTSVELANIFLNGAIRLIKLWVRENGSSRTPSHYYHAMDSTWSSCCRLYWLSNALQLLIYLKRDGKMIVDTIEPQLEVTSLVHEFLQEISLDLDCQINQLIGPALINWNANESRLEHDFFGFAKRKTILRVPSLLDSLQSRGNRREMLANLYSESTSSLSFIISSIPNAGNATHSAGSVKQTKQPSDFFTMFTTLLTACKSGGVHPGIVTQLAMKFCASISNHLLTRILKQRSLCSRSRAQQLQMNLSEITDWIRETQVVNFNNVSVLIDIFAPVFQVLHFLQVISTCSQVSAFTSLYESFTFLSYELMHHLMAQYRFEKGEQSFPDVVQLHVQSKVDEKSYLKFGRSEVDRLTPSRILADSNSFAKGQIPDYLCDFQIPGRDESVYWKGNPSVPRVVLEMISQGPI